MLSKHKRKRERTYTLNYNGTLYFLIDDFSGNRMGSIVVIPAGRESITIWKIMDSRLRGNDMSGIFFDTVNNCFHP